MRMKDLLGVSLRPLGKFTSWRKQLCFNVAGREDGLAKLLHPPTVVFSCRPRMLLCTVDRILVAKFSLYQLRLVGSSWNQYTCLRWVTVCSPCCIYDNNTSWMSFHHAVSLVTNLSVTRLRSTLIFTRIFKGALCLWRQVTVQFCKGYASNLNKIGQIFKIWLLGSRDSDKKKMIHKTQWF